MNNNPIGVFDSGVGGLSCVPAIKGKLPKEQIIYYGDTANAPYGSRSDEEIIELAVNVAGELVKRGCKSLSIACNTISCVAIPAIEKAFPGVPVIGIVRPAAEFTAKNFKGKRVGLIATEATVRSGAYSKAIEEYGGGIQLKAKATPAFVPLIEAGKAGSDEMLKCISDNLNDFAKDLDALILGCTHYPFIKDQIKALYPHLEIIDPAQALSEKTADILKQNTMLSDDKIVDDIYIASLESEAFKKMVADIEKNVYEYDLAKLTANLEKNDFSVSHFKTGKEAAEYLNSKIDGKSVGFGGSISIDEIGIYEMLESHNKLVSHWRGASRYDAALTDVYITSTNALAETGEIINIDGSGNRVASMNFGHKEVYMIVGKNKIAADFDKALWRARNIAAPKNVQRLKSDTPCAVNADKCYNCSSKDRRCRSLNVLWGKPASIDHFELLLIDEELGY